MPSVTMSKKPAKRRGRPVKKTIAPIKAEPEEVAQALVRAAERKGEERRKELA